MACVARYTHLCFPGSHKSNLTPLGLYIMLMTACLDHINLSDRGIYRLHIVRCCNGRIYAIPAEDRGSA